MASYVAITPAALLEQVLQRAIAEEAVAVDMVLAPDGAAVSLEKGGQSREILRFPPSQWEPLRRLLADRAEVEPGEDPYQRALVFTEPYRDQLYFVTATVGPHAIRLVPSLSPPGG